MKSHAALISIALATGVGSATAACPGDAPRQAQADAAALRQSMHT